jgi:hypothetical protein
MPQDIANINLTAAEITALTGALQTIRTTLGTRAVSLDPDQRRTLVKMGDNTRVFCQQAVAGLQSNAGSIPPDLNLPGLAQDLADYTALEAFYAEYEAVGELLDDTLKALASDVMTGSIIGVSFLKALNKINPGLDTLLGSLKQVRRRKPTKPAPSAPSAPPTA